MLVELLSPGAHPTKDNSIEIQNSIKFVIDRV